MFNLKFDRSKFLPSDRFYNLLCTICIVGYIGLIFIMAHNHHYGPMIAVSIYLLICIGFLIANMIKRGVLIISKRI